MSCRYCIAFEVMVLFSSYHYHYAPPLPPYGKGIMHWWRCPLSICLSVRLSVCLSVLCLTLNRVWKGMASWEVRVRKPVTRMTRDLIYRSKSERSRSPGRLTPWPKISRIIGTGRSTNFKLGIWMKYDDPHHRPAQWPPKSKFAVITSRRQFDACCP